MGFKPKCGGGGAWVENKRKNEVKIQKLKPKILHLRQATLVKQDQLICI